MYNEFAKYARTNKQLVETIISLGQKLRNMQIISMIVGKIYRSYYGQEKSSYWMEKCKIY